MKKFTFLVLGLCAGGLWTACDDLNVDENLATYEENEVHIKVDETSLTRAGKTDFELNDSIGIFAVKRTDKNTVAIPHETGNQGHNAKWIKTNNGWEPATSVDKITWDQNGNAMDFYAYYPYDRNATNPDAIVFQLASNQDDAATWKASDILRAANTQGLTSGDVELHFTHILSMVDVNCQADGITLSNSLTTKLTDIVSQFTLNLGTGEQTLSETFGNVQMRRVDTETPHYQALIPAQSIAEAQSKIQCDNDGTVYIYQIPQVQWSKGDTQKYQITLK